MTQIEKLRWVWNIAELPEILRYIGWQEVIMPLLVYTAPFFNYLFLKLKVVFFLSHEQSLISVRWLQTSLDLGGRQTTAFKPDTV